MKRQGRSYFYARAKPAAFVNTRKRWCSWRKRLERAWVEIKKTRPCPAAIQLSDSRRGPLRDSLLAEPFKAASFAPQIAIHSPSTMVLKFTQRECSVLRDFVVVRKCTMMRGVCLFRDQSLARGRSESKSVVSRSETSTFHLAEFNGSRWAKSKSAS